MWKFSEQHLANTAWACAKVRHSDEKLFAALARAAERLVSQFKEHGLVNTAWALAKVGQSDEKLFAALARAADRCVVGFTEKELVMTLWVFARRESLKHAWHFFDHA